MKFQFCLVFSLVYSVSIVAAETNYDQLEIEVF